jgi:hypothetical protein
MLPHWNESSNYFIRFLSINFIIIKKRNNGRNATDSPSASIYTSILTKENVFAILYSFMNKK